MDPIAAVGLASGILTFVDAGTKLIKTAYAIHNSLDGVLDDNRHREGIAGTVQDAASKLEITGYATLTKEQQSLTDLAKRCKAISESLIQLLEDIKPKGSSFKAFNALLYAVKANKNKRLIGDLESRLNDYRDQLSHALIDISRVEAADGFSRLIFLAKNNEAKLKSLMQAMEHLRQQQLSVQGSCPPKELLQLLVVDTTARHSMYQDFILTCITFQEAHQRYDAVHTAHEDTFKWIYDPIEPIEYHDDQPSYSQVECRKMQIQSRDTFLTWLSSEAPLSPIFHISGKLGCGKSTLMKFLCSHPRTTEELIKWAGAKEFAFTSFFFWRNGSTAGKSLDGLCRSILHCLLAEQPDLIAEVLPLQWKEAEQRPWKMHSRQEIPSREVKHALEKLLQDIRLYEHHRFCILIDGLDKFKPGSQDGLDHADLVDILRLWASHAKGNLKLCLSSRKEPIFMEGFADTPSFQLQDLTKFDIQNYIRSRLSGLTDNNLKEELIGTIPEIASSIFLWIYLVIKSIRNKIAHRATGETLRKYLETLPQDLESLFHHVLQQLEPDNKRKTLQLISCLQVAKSYKLDLPLIAFSLLENYSQDSNFSLRDSLEDEMLPDESVLQAQLWGASGGLIECHSRAGGQKVMEFVHRSVPDMFHRDARNPDLTREMDVALRGINCIDLMSHLRLAAVRLSISDPEFHDNQGKFRDLRARVCIKIAQARLIHGIDKPPYQFLRHIDTWIETVRVGEDSKVWVDIYRPYVFYMEIHEKTATGTSSRWKSFFNPQSLASVGDGRYIDWKIRNDPFTLNNSVNRAMVGHSLLMSNNWELFFRYSISTRDTRIPLCLNNCGIWSFRRWPSDDEWSFTVWQIFLINIILTGFINPEGPVDIISRFLREGADPYCRLLIKDGPKGTVTFRFRETQCPQYPFFIYHLKGFRNGINRCLALRGSPEIDWHTDPKDKISPQEISLREWVAATDWNNRDNLIELLDCSYEEDSDN